MVMESSIPPEMDITLKMELAENKYHPDQGNLKETAFVLMDMLKAIDKGNTELSPTTRNKYYSVNNLDEGGSKIKPINKILTDKKDK